VSKSGLPDQVSWVAFVKLQAIQIVASDSCRPRHRQVASLEGQDFAPQWTPHPHQDDAICCPDLYLHQHQLAEVATKSDSKNTESLSLIGFRGGPYQDLHCGMEHSTKALSCGGLGVPDMKLLGIALRARWL
jgi:hypothetical protein